MDHTISLGVPKIVLKLDFGIDGYLELRCANYCVLKRESNQIPVCLGLDKWSNNRGKITGKYPYEKQKEYVGFST